MLRVINFAAVEPYTVTITYDRRRSRSSRAQVESYTLTCERGGQVFGTQQVVDRPRPGQAARPAGVRGRDPAACAAGNIGFRSVSAARSGGGVRLGFKRSGQPPGARRRVPGLAGRAGSSSERLVARFRRPQAGGPLERAGEPARQPVTDGYYFARFRMAQRQAQGDPPRHARRRNGRFTRRPDFYRRATCDLLPSYKLERPVFGGARRTPLRIAFQVATRLRARRSPSCAARRPSSASRRARRRQAHAPARSPRASCARGDYRVRIIVGRGAGRVATLVSRPPASVQLVGAFHYPSYVLKCVLYFERIYDDNMARLRHARRAREDHWRPPSRRRARAAALEDAYRMMLELQDPDAAGGAR